MSETAYQATRAAAENLIACIQRNLVKWRTWFPNEQSEVDVPRGDLIALAHYADLGLMFTTPPVQDRQPALADIGMKFVGIYPEVAEQHRGRIVKVLITMRLECSVLWMDRQELLDNLANQSISELCKDELRNALAALEQSEYVKSSKES